MPGLNILYLHSHDTGRYIQPYGHAVATPRLQRLAEEGVLFRQAFCVNPTCSASRSALLTGAYPHGNGMTGLAHRGFSLRDYRWHMASALRHAGYHSVLSGVQHEAARAGDREGWRVIGYDECLGGHGAAETQAARWLASRPPKPFFLSVGFFETHREYPGLDELTDDPRYTLPPAPLPDTPETRQDMARFKTMARRLDGKMGVVLDALAAAGLAENTLVVCTTDHGIAFPRMKCNLHDSGTGVLLILRGPGGFHGGKTVDAMVTHLDVFPTVCEAAGIEAPPWLAGKSLVTLAAGKVSALHEEIFLEVNYHAAYEPMRAVRTARWKYMRRFDGRDRPVLPNCDKGESRSYWLSHGWRDRPVPGESLFDLVFDPNESDNLAARPGHEEVLADLRGRLDAWMKETADPLLLGAVPAPVGAVVTDADELDPEGRKRPPGPVHQLR